LRHTRSGKDEKERWSLKEKHRTSRAKRSRVPKDN